MSTRAVNPGWGPKGADTYSIWLYKGGGACHHFWMRKTYMFTLDSKRIDVKSPLAPTISVSPSISTECPKLLLPETTPEVATSDAWNFCC